MKMFKFQQPNVLESCNWYQMIAMTIVYNHVIRNINKLSFLFLKYLRNLKCKRKISAKGRGYTNKIANISVTKSSRELKLVSNHC